jgi:hypothetical protein
MSRVGGRLRQRDSRLPIFLPYIFASLFTRTWPLLPHNFIRRSARGGQRQGRLQGGGIVRVP